ncbi:UDP-N-acetylglucosamine 2-epimerase (hydrolyzing) [Candidatus Sumerlaeota bacterium]|nr:UDP-N-acetylglucosamine 2-epimerase (hydrolyzing) [Candidatus Sumerlaeota bacterium]
MRTIGVVTTSRADYGIYYPVLKAIQAEPELRLQLYVSGMHLAPVFGSTVRQIEQDGFEIIERVEMLVASDTPEAISKSMGLGTIGFAQAFARSRPDILLVLGDRFEMHAAALAALPFKIPLAHIHGGEKTEGAIDDALRHSITKLSHWHFVSTEQYARRVMQLGEDPLRVTVCGAPGLDNIASLKLLTAAELEARFPIQLEPAPLIVTYHPVTLEHEDSARQVENLLGALEDCGLPVVFTLPNADTGGAVIRECIAQFVQTHGHAYQADNLGAQAYFSLMQLAKAMVGNSSSGIIEAPSFGLPVVNIGSRQAGRVMAENVICCGYERDEIASAIKRAASDEFAAQITNCINPYDAGGAASIIIKQLKEIEITPALTHKKFVDRI